MLVEFTPQGVTNKKNRSSGGRLAASFVGVNSLQGPNIRHKKIPHPVIFKNPHIWEPKKIEGMGLCLARENISSKLGFGVPCLSFFRKFLMAIRRIRLPNPRTYLDVTGHIPGTRLCWQCAEWIMFHRLIDLGLSEHGVCTQVFYWEHDDKPSNFWKTMCSPSGCHHSIVHYKKSWISPTGGPINHVTIYNISWQYQLYKHIYDLQDKCMMIADNTPYIYILYMKCNFTIHRSTRYSWIEFNHAKKNIYLKYT